MGGQGRLHQGCVADGKGNATMRLDVAYLRQVGRGPGAALGARGLFVQVGDVCVCVC
jgi:hypothetical protein